MKTSPLKKLMLLTAGIIGGAVALGPRPNYPKFDPQLPDFNVPLEKLEEYISKKEAQFPLKPDNHARITWADSVRQTDVSIVFIHGFSASPVEGNPVVANFAKHFGCNVFYTRLPEHGIENKECFSQLSPKDLIDSAKEAIQIGNILGKKTIVMGSSTGCTLGIYLAAHHPEKVHALMLYSPLIDLHDKATKLLAFPWGLQLANLVNGSPYRQLEFENPEAKNYWTNEYRMEGVLCLRNLVNNTMKPEIFKKITQPLFLGYYFKDAENCDKVVSVDAMKNFFNQINTPDHQKQLVPFPEANAHVITSVFQTNKVEEVTKASIKFWEEIIF